jgi:site-specific DNA-methyltransferase (cytosine-N4-specific)
VGFKVDWLNKCHFGDVRDVLRQMIADGVKVQTIVTSPPYWGLRSYLPADHQDKAHEIGSEPTLGEFLTTMVGVFDLCHHVLADDGTMWVNMGDSYAGSWGAQSREHAGKHAGNPSAISANQIKAAEIRESGTGSLTRTPGLKSKDLMGQPWRLAFALQDAGWYLRQDIIWHKPSPMPESIKDRCTKAHEYVFLMSKGERYYFDQGAIRTPLSAETKPLSFETMDFKARDKYKMPDGWNTGAGGHGSFHPEGREKGAPASKRNSFARESKNTAGEHGQKPQHRPERDEVHYANSANKRSVWTVATEAYPGSHYATFPRALIEPCILAGAPAGAIVLDIFMGSGTTAQVAEQLGRKWIGIDIDVRNKELQDQRLQQPSLDLEAA